MANITQIFNLGSFVKNAAALAREPLTTERLTIKGLADCSPAQLYDFFYADDKTLLRRWEPWGWDAQHDYSGDYLIDHFKNAEENRKMVYFGILKHDRVIGFLQLRADDKNRTRLSYFVIPSERRNGYAEEAYSAFMAKYAPLSRDEGLYATVDPDNTASQNFLKKLGFRETGLDIESDGNPVYGFEKPVRDFISS
jgi:RimJ/RimL family protein N-acetyltransferase